MNAVSTTELEHSLLTKLVEQNEEDQKEIRLREKRVKERDPLIRALRSKLGVTSGPNSGTVYGTKAGMIKDAIQALSKPRFTQRDIEDEIKRANPTVEIESERIKSVLWTLQKKKQLIRQVQKGNNRGVAAEFEKLPTNGASNGRQTNEANRLAYGVATNTGVLTIGEFEQFVREKNRRVNEVVAHFNVDEGLIYKFLGEPTSKVFRGEKGWLKIRE